jgi:hypothetical protein
VRVAATFFCTVGFLLCCACKPHNVFSFCRDFDPTGCITPVAEKVVYSASEKTVRNKTIRDFANSVYFRGDRLAFELKNARSKYDVTFECLHGRYAFSPPTGEKLELEYLELRDNNVYGLVMLGSLIEKKYTITRVEPYRPLEPFLVAYGIYCGKDKIAERSILIELK